MAHHDALTDLPNRVLLRERLEQALDEACRTARLGRALPRPRPLQGRQRHARPSGRRRAAEGRGRAAAPLRRRRRYGRAPRRRRVRHRPGRLASNRSPPRRWRRASSRRSASPIDIDGHQVVVGTSIGIAVAPNDGTDPDQLLKNADLALYRAKSEGRGIHRFFEPDMDAHMQARRKLRARPAQGAGRRRVRAALPAARQPRARRDQRLRSAAALAPSRARHWSRRSSSFRSRRRPG